MQAYSDQLLSDMETSLSFIVQTDQSWINRSRSAVVFINTQIDHLKTFISKHRFANQPEEIRFFKEIKPQFAGRLLYYGGIHQVEVSVPEGNTKLIRKHYKKALASIGAFFSGNKDLYQYLRSGNTHLDAQYFTRKQCDATFSLCYPSFDKDPKFTSLHDHTVSQIYANSLLKTWLENKLQQVSNPQQVLPSPTSTKSNLQWTDSKTALVELLYALYAQRSFNNGAVDVKELATFFQTIFNIDLGDYYRTYVAIKTRKSKRGKFLETIHNEFLKSCNQAID